MTAYPPSTVASPHLFKKVVVLGSVWSESLDCDLEVLVAIHKENISEYNQHQFKDIPFLLFFISKCTR